MSVPDDFDIKDAVKNISANFEQPDKFAEIFCSAAAKQKSIDAVLKAMIRDVLKTDKETIEHIKTVQRAVNDEDWRSFVKKIGIAGWSVVMIIIGAAIKKYIG